MTCKHRLSRLAKANADADADASEEFLSGKLKPAFGQTTNGTSYPSHLVTRATFIKCALEFSCRNTGINAPQYFGSLLQ